MSATRLQVTTITSTSAPRMALTKDVVPTLSDTKYSIPSWRNDTTSSANPTFAGVSDAFSMWRIVWSKSNTHNFLLAIFF